jgi:hypothetical protein
MDDEHARRADPDGKRGCTYSVCRVGLPENKVSQKERKKTKKKKKEPVNGLKLLLHHADLIFLVSPPIRLPHRLYFYCCHTNERGAGINSRRRQGQKERAFTTC